ncbi:MAG: response regulator [candidate division KSB1 bacterium]|nr:response regulator [candidate division KSB1 bacterium]MDZ7358233.1 response regulator [candidate division KSB1 bacterium]
MNQQFDILIIDDEQIIVKATRKLLVLEGFNIDEAVDVETAIEKLQQNSYKLIISDLMLPRVSGINLINRLKITHPDVPVIIISGYAMVENAIRSFRAGAFDFLPKPFDVHELLGVVYRAMRHRAIIKDAGQRDAKHVSSAEISKAWKKEKSDYYFLGQHSWARLESEGAVTFGIGQTFFGRIGPLERIEFPTRYSDLWQGNLCVRIFESKELIHLVWAPLSGKVIEINHELQQNPNLINSDPFGRGWLLKMLPTCLESELDNLNHQ